MRDIQRTLLGSVGFLALAGAIVVACSASESGSPGSTGSAGGGAGAAGGGSPGVGGSGGSTGSFTTSDSSSSTASGIGGACAGVSSEASSQVQPADIIIAVDTSGSMDEESAEVQQNLNNFAAVIAGSGIDVHVVLIADSSVCIPAPLGSGACAGADESLPGYRHVLQSVGSNDALQQILNTYPQWQPSLRPNATTTIAVVSDDDSDLSAANFTSQLLALDPAKFQGFKFDSIVSSQNPETCVFQCFQGGAPGVCCPGCVPLSAAEGTVYKQLVQQTSGVFGDLCLQDFDPVFNDMATAVVTGSSISCEYTIPEVPGGDPVDPTKVNVTYADGGPPQTIGYVAGGAAACGQQTGGWYYDNPQNPTKINLCPATCSAVQGSATGKVEVLFGCDTIPAIPE